MLTIKNFKPGYYYLDITGAQSYCIYAISEDELAGRAMEFASDMVNYQGQNYPVLVIIYDEYDNIYNIKLE